MSEGAFHKDALPTLLASAGNAFKRMIIMGAVSIGQPRARSVIIEPLLDGLNDATLAVGVFGVNPVYAVGRNSIVGYRADKLGELTLTANNTTTPKNLYGDTEAEGTYRHADTISYAPTDYGTVLQTAFGSEPAEHSPGTDQVGRFVLFDAFGYQAIALDPVGVPAFNALYRLVT